LIHLMHSFAGNMVQQQQQQQQQDGEQQQQAKQQPQQQQQKQQQEPPQPAPRLSFLSSRNFQAGFKFFLASALALLSTLLLIAHVPAIAHYMPVFGITTTIISMQDRVEATAEKVCRAGCKMKRRSTKAQLVMCDLLTPQGYQELLCFNTLQCHNMGIRVMTLSQGCQQPRVNWCSHRVQPWPCNVTTQVSKYWMRDSMYDCNMYNSGEVSSSVLVPMLVQLAGTARTAWKDVSTEAGTAGTTTALLLLYGQLLFESVKLVKLLLFVQCGAGHLPAAPAA
jgi:hypothetical protein